MDEYFNPNNKQSSENSEGQIWWNQPVQSPQPVLPQPTAEGTGYSDSSASSKLMIAAIIIAAVLLFSAIGVGAAFASGILHLPNQQQDTVEEAEDSLRPSSIYVTVHAEGSNEKTSAVTLSVLDLNSPAEDQASDAEEAEDSKADEDSDDVTSNLFETALMPMGISVEKRVNIGTLEKGSYSLHVDDLPINEDTSTYLEPLFDLAFEVDGSGEDVELELTLDPVSSGDEESTEENAENTENAEQGAESGSETPEASSAATESNEPDSGSSADSETASSSGTSGQSSHTHNWQPVTTTKHHDAVYRTVNHAAVNKRVCICDSCGEDITDRYSAHKSSTGHTKYHYETKQVTAAYSEKVLVSKAYDETVTTGYKCSGCGQTKSK